MISERDISELRRIATNTYDADKAFMISLINKITRLNQEVTELKKKVEQPK